MSEIMKKILVISEDFFPGVGGTVIYTNNLCQSLVKDGHHVILLAPHRPEDEQLTHEFEYQVERFGKCIKNGTLKRIYTAAYLFKNINKYIEKYNPDIIHISAGQYAMFGLTCRIKKLTKPLIWTIHNVAPAEVQPLYLSNNERLNHLINSVYYYLLWKVDCFTIRCKRYSQIISVSESTRQKIIKAGGDAEKISIVPNGVISKSNYESLEQGISHDEFNVVVVGRLSRNKGQYQMLLALDKLVNRIPNIKCYFVGPTNDTEYVSEIQSYINMNFIHDEAIMTGAVSDDDLEYYYSICDVYVQPSYQEGFSITVMEAMLHGKPVIGTETGAIPMLLSDGRGICVKSPEPELLADAIYQMYSNSELRESCSKLGKQYILENYEWSNVCKKIEKVYESQIHK